MTAVMDGVARQRIDAVRTRLDQELKNITSGRATNESTEDAVRAAVRQLDALVLEPVVLEWLTATGRAWPQRQVPWKQLATALDSPERSPATQTRVDKQLAAVFADRAPQRRAAVDRRSGAGYSVVAMWAAITEWHLDAGLPLPITMWRRHSHAATILDLLPAIADHPEITQPGTRTAAVLRAAGHRIPTTLQTHVAEIARHHHATACRWVAATQ